MKYSIKKLTEDFIFDELEQVRKQFVEALSYTLESAAIIFDKNADDPLDIYIEYDFQQNNDENVIYGFNLAEEIARNFSLDINQTHSSEQLLKISQSLKKLATEIESRFDPEPSKTIAEIKDKKDTEYASNINRSYREVLRDALAEDEALKKEFALKRSTNSKEFLETDYQLKSDQQQTPSLQQNLDD